MAKNRRSSRRRPRTAVFPVVGIGASAGGLEAFTALLKALPPDTGMAFVLVQHMDPKHQSLLYQLLSKATSMPVAQIADRTRLRPNRVYVIPPNKHLTVDGGVLRLANLRGGHLPIDNFFSSLAKDRQEKAIGVILSGTASDGTRGLEAIKDSGGITFAQEPKSAKYTGMPMSAVASGSVDFVLPPHQIAHQLQRKPRHRGALAPEAVSEPREESKALQTIFRLIRTATDVDFSLYKLPTIKRRLRRRMLLRETPDLDQYAQYLQAHPSEIRDLFEDILIPVTSFFREPQTFQALQNDVFPKIAARARKAESIRIWVAGCSTGEEAYSIAIALLEYLGSQAHQVKIQIFGTDLSERGIQVARNGLYADAAVENVSKDRLRRFFLKTEGGYQIAKSIREICIFARHDLAKDPPFAKLDLISCQNVFIYFESTLQKRIMVGFHYALKPSGFLVLGKSEAPTAYTDFFTLEDRKNKIFSRKPLVVRPLLAVPIPSFENTHPATLESAEARASNVVEEARRILLENYSAPAFIVDSDLNILHFQGDTSPFIKPSTGAASFHLLKIRKFNRKIKIVFLTMHTESAYVQEGFEAGASGYVIKHSATIDLLSAIRQSLLGLRYVTPGVAENVAGALLRGSRRARTASAQLTSRQREVLQLLAEGLSAKEAAAILNLSSRTVEFHKYRIMQRLGLRTTAQITQFAIKHRIISG